MTSDMRDIGLAHRILRRSFGLNPQNQNYDDALQIARIALFNAEKYYDPDTGFKFSTYASRAIVRSVAIWLNVQKRHGFGHVDKDLLPSKPIRLEASNQDGEINAYDPECVQTNGLDAYEFKETADVLHRALFRMVTIKPRGHLWARVIHFIYYRGLTLRQIASTLGVCRERVRQYQACGIDWIKKRYEKDLM